MEGGDLVILGVVVVVLLAVTYGFKRVVDRQYVRGVKGLER